VSPRVVFGVPVFEKAAHLEAAVRSLLNQSYRDLAVVLVDDGSGDDSVAIARRLAAEDSRAEVHVNLRRLGMLGNTNRALALALERHPAAEFWALGSDHDLWSPVFVERLVALLDAHPEAVLAHPLAERIDAHGHAYPGAKRPGGVDMLGVGDPLGRLATAFRTMAAGNTIYALFRTSALRSRRLYRPVLVPDRLLLSEMALRGTFALAPEVLWWRRFRGLASLDRQRRAFFPDAVPWWAYLPWWVQHTAAIGMAYAVRGEGASSGVGRVLGVRLTLRYLALALALRFRRRRARVRRWVRRSRRHATNRILERYGERGGRLARRGVAASGRVPALRGVTEQHLRPSLERVAERLASGGRR
jgi:glycosyltransferase involved in cell wall biosynthesis